MSFKEVGFSRRDFKSHPVFLLCRRYSSDSDPTADNATDDIITGLVSTQSARTDAQRSRFGHLGTKAARFQRVLYQQVISIHFRVIGVFRKTALGKAGNPIHQHYAFVWWSG